MPRRNANAYARRYIPQTKGGKGRKVRVTHNSECDSGNRVHHLGRQGICRECGRRYVAQTNGMTDVLYVRPPMEGR